MVDHEKSLISSLEFPLQIGAFLSLAAERIAINSNLYALEDSPFYGAAKVTIICWLILRIGYDSFKFMDKSPEERNYRKLTRDAFFDIVALTLIMVLPEFINGIEDSQLFTDVENIIEGTIILGGGVGAGVTITAIIGFLDRMFPHGLDNTMNFFKNRLAAASVGGEAIDNYDQVADEVYQDDVEWVAQGAD